MRGLLFLLSMLVCSVGYAQSVCTPNPVVCDDNYVHPAIATVRAKNPAVTCAAQYVDVKVNTTTTRITYGTGWCAAGGASCTNSKANACASLAAQIGSLSGIRNANCNSKYEVTVTPNPSGVNYFNLATSLGACVGVVNPASGGSVTIGQSKFVEGGNGTLAITALDGTTGAAVTVGSVTATSATIPTLTAAAASGTTATYPTVVVTTIDKAAGGVLSIAPTTATSVTVGKPTTVSGLLTGSGGVKTASPMLLLNTIRFCGNGSNGTTEWFDGPVTIAEYYAAAQTTGSAACDANDSATEGTADEVIYVSSAIKVVGMTCNTEAGGAADTNTFQLRASTANVTGVTCSVTNDGSLPKSCTVILDAPVTVAANAPLAVRNVQSGSDDMSAKDIECIVFHTY